MRSVQMTVLLAMTVIVAGCAVPPKFDGPGSFQDFANVRYQCIQETSARTSSGSANQYGAYTTSAVMPSCSAFQACLASKGYYAQPNGKFDSASIPVKCSR